MEINLERAREVSALVQSAGNYRVDGWRPVVGENLFTRESGAVANQFHLPAAIEPYSSEIVGAPRRIVLGKKSGLLSIKLKAEELGIDLPDSLYAPVLAKVKALGTAEERLVSDDEFRRLTDDARAAA